MIFVWGGYILLVSIAIVRGVIMIIIISWSNKCFRFKWNESIDRPFWPFAKLNNFALANVRLESTSYSISVISNIVVFHFTYSLPFTGTAPMYEMNGNKIE